MPQRVRSKYNIDSTGLSEKLKCLRLDKDENNDLPAIPIIGFNPYRNPSYAVLPVTITDPTTPTTSSAIGTTITEGYNTTALLTNSVTAVKDPSTGYTQLVRTPGTYKSVQCNTAAATAVWTPATGKKFRLMGGVITFEAPTLAAAAASTITFLDSAAAITLAFGCFVPAAASGVAVPISFDLKPNGYLSSAANNVLNATLTANLTGGYIRITVWGTEE